MSDKKNKPELYVVGEDDGITEIPDDSKGKRIDETKRRVARNIKRFDAKRNRHGARLSPLAYGIIIALIFVVVYVVADISSGGFIYNANGRFVSLFADKTSKNFSVSTDSDKVYDFESFGKGFVMLSDNGVAFIGKNGEKTSSQQFTYSSPAIEINGERTVVYDRGNTSYSLMKNGKIYSQQKTDNKIIDFALSAKDNYAVAVKDENAKSVLIGMDARGKVIYQWNCPKGYISDVAITPAGGKVAVTVIDSANAVLSSTVYILDFEYDSAYAQFEYNAETVLSAKFLSDRKVQIVTDKNVYCISGKEQNVVAEFGTDDIYFCDFSEKYTAVVTKDYSRDDFFTLSLFAKNGKLKCSVELNGKVRGLSVSDKSVSVLFSDKTETYSKRGKLVGSIDNINHYDDIALAGNFIYVLSSDSVKKYPAYGNISHFVAEEETAYGGTL